MNSRSFGELLRDWRRRRGLTQLDLGLEAGVSTRHLSYVENGRSQPSREMVERLAERLDVPLRERSQLLVAAGYAPTYQQRSLDLPEMAAARQALNQILDSHEPFPGLVVDRYWNVVFGNDAAMALFEDADPELVAPPVNVLRLALHPKGFASRLVNLAEVRTSLLGRLRRSLEASGDPGLASLYEEVRGYPPGEEAFPSQPLQPSQPGPNEIALPLRFRTDDGELAFFSTVSTFGTAYDITLSELSIELLFPADRKTAELMTGRPGPVVE
ncbi:helix-turn-helix domain-containing protein [Flindersiella endophytica]